MFPKEKAVRSEPYRRLVAALPCINCGIWGYSQAAHPPTTGKGRKEDDRLCVPLCCARPGIRGCHADCDQYRLADHDQTKVKMTDWAAQTQARIKNNGDWRAEWN